jgi:outer membrane receptor protein involved in Fe transport
MTCRERTEASVARIVLLAAIVAAATTVARPANAQTSALAISGYLRDRADGTPIPGAVVTLIAPSGARISSTTSDQNGAFAFAAPSAGRYRLGAEAHGYRSTSMALAVTGPIARRIIIALTRSGRIDEIGRVVSRSSGGADAVPGQRVSEAALSEASPLRIADVLGKLSGVTVSGDSLAPGGDSYVSLRGLRPGESQTLLDGHPVGPIGIQPEAPDADGTSAGFNYQDAPYFAIRTVDVKFGAQAGSATAGVLGGTVDLLTFDPTERDQVVVQQGFGNEGRASTSLRATGTEGKLGYALVSGVAGTYGLFAGGPIAQTGLRGTDLTTATLRALTYTVSGDYVLRNGLAKVVYAPSAGTRVILSSYDATSWADKTGEGDNDFNPYAYVLANAPVGASGHCPRGVLVSTDSGSACVAPSNYAAAASGPAGGGPGAWQALRNQDDDVRITTIAGKSSYALDAFTDQYAVVYHRAASLASGPLDAFLDRWSTQGIRVHDELGARTNAFEFGLSWLRQALNGDGTTPDGSALVANPPAQRIDESTFVRDTFSPNRRLSLIVDAALEKSSLDPRAHVDPQLSIVYQPAQRDTLRLSAGQAAEEPALQIARVNVLPVGALNPDCGAIARATSAAPAAVNVGSGPATNLSAETGSDLELGYDHRFGSYGNLGLTIYDTNVNNLIVTGEFPANGQLAPSVVAPLLARIDQFCGLSPAPGEITLTLGRSFNAATARLRGLELAGLVHVSAHLALEYGFDVQSIVLDDLPAFVLENSPTLVNGLQMFEVPLHKATLGIDATTRGGLEIRLEGHAVGPNNPQQLPGYAYADASLAQELSKRVTLMAAISNVFDGHAQSYGLVGLGLPYATNAHDATLRTPFLQPFNERYGLEPTGVQMSATIQL